MAIRVQPFLREKPAKNRGVGRFNIKVKNGLAWHRRCDVYCGARETVGGSSVSVVAGVRTVTTKLNGHGKPQSLLCPFSLCARNFPVPPFPATPTHTFKASISETLCQCCCRRFGHGLFPACYNLSVRFRPTVTVHLCFDRPTGRGVRGRGNAERESSAEDEAG